MLDLKKNSEAIDELISFVLKQPNGYILIPLVFRLANNYKLVQSEQFKKFVSTLVSQQLESNNINVKFIESLILIGEKQEAFRLL